MIHYFSFNRSSQKAATASQEQSACAVALTCPEGSTTVTPPPTGTLVITKICIPGCPNTEFGIAVMGNNPVTPSSFTIGDGGRQTVTLGSGSFTIHEFQKNPIFRASFEGDCMQTGPGVASGTIGAGQRAVCIITNSAV